MKYGKLNDYRIAVIIPCYNEASTIASVIENFRHALPEAGVYVCDNRSGDGTGQVARAAGAHVLYEPRPGKGNAVRRLFRDVEADFYVLVDGDGTYDASMSTEMIDMAIDDRADFVNSVRFTPNAGAYRFGHQIGNRLLTGMVRAIFGYHIKDMLSGYKVMSRRFVKSLPVLSNGFDIETEMAVHAMELSMPIVHSYGVYSSRPPGSVSKLSTYRDGIRILLRILALVKHERPMTLFSCIAGFFFTASLVLGIPLIATFIRIGLVPRLPTAVLALGLMVISALSLFSGVILDTVTRGRREVRMLAYLGISYPVCRSRTWPNFVPDGE